ncbi:MAG: FHA domain-containing protein [Anaerolineales bacterium]|jgi:hypothetical protein
MASRDFKLIGPDGREIPIGPQGLTLGRHTSNNVVIKDPRVSRKHARLLLAAGRCWIRDLGSDAGTFVNGSPVRGQQEIRPNDTLVIGVSSFTLAATAAPAFDAARDRKVGRPSVLVGIAGVAAVILVIGLALVGGGRGSGVPQSQHSNPATSPPMEEPPSTSPPVDEPPSTSPPVDEPPSTSPPSDETESPPDDEDEGEPELSTGEVQVTLRWNTSALLELVVDYSVSAGSAQWEVNARIDCDEPEVSHPVINAFWPAGTAPDGLYTVLVRNFDDCGETEPTAYEVVVKFEGQIIGAYSDTIFGLDVHEVAQFER